MESFVAKELQAAPKRLSSASPFSTTAPRGSTISQVTRVPPGVP
jgi:hypothetical protein